MQAHTQAQAEYALREIRMYTVYPDIILFNNDRSPDDIQKERDRYVASQMRKNWIRRYPKMLNTWWNDRDFFERLTTNMTILVVFFQILNGQGEEVECLAIFNGIWSKYPTLSEAYRTLMNIDKDRNISLHLFTADE